MSVRILIGDCRERLRELPEKSVHMCVTSPPYFGLRSYLPEGHADKAKEIGLEQTPAEFVAELVEVFREVRRVLRDDGTCWVNLGDSYANDGKWGGSSGGKHVDALHGSSGVGRGKRATGLKPKDLIGIPWRVAFALQDDGWYLRQDIIWHKPNPMPESVTDRCTKAHEYLFLLAKSPRYYYDADAILEARTQKEDANIFRGGCYVGGETDNATLGKRRTPGNKTHKAAAAYDAGDEKHRTKAGLISYSERERAADPGDLGTRNKRSVWTVGSEPFKGAHFATFPPSLIEPCILAGSPALCCSRCGAPVERQAERVDSGFDGSKYGERAVAASGGAITGGTAKSTLGSSNGRATGKRETTGFAPTCGCDADLTPGTVLDPFGGAGTTGMVADRLRRNAILVELDTRSVEIARKRLEGDAGMFSEVEAA